MGVTSLHSRRQTREICKCNLVQSKRQMDKLGTLGLKTASSNHDPLLIPDHGINIQIQIKEISKATPYKFLCIHLAFDGNSKAQAEAMH
jgi:hypothetical protein